MKKQNLYNVTVYATLSKDVLVYAELRPGRVRQHRPDLLRTAGRSWTSPPRRLRKSTPPAWASPPGSAVRAAAATVPVASAAAASAAAGWPTTMATMRKTRATRMRTRTMKIPASAVSFRLVKKSPCSVRSPGPCCWTTCWAACGNNYARG